MKERGEKSGEGLFYFNYKESEITPGLRKKLLLNTVVRKKEKKKSAPNT